MARRKAAPKRVIIADPLFESVLLAKFINNVMQRGKKSVAEGIVYHALDIVVQRLRQQPGKGVEASDTKGKETSEGSDGSIFADAGARRLALESFKKVMDGLGPMVEVKSRRVGGATYQVPVEVAANRKLALAMRWLIEYAKKRHEKTMVQRLAAEILDALDGRGGAMRKREETHKMAKANQAFAHYRY